MTRKRRTASLALTAFVAACAVILFTPALRSRALHALSRERRAGGVAEAATSAAGDNKEPSGSDAGENDGASEAMLPLPVRGAVVRRSDFVLTVRASGRAEAVQQADLGLQVADRVKALHVSEGQHVGKGQVMLELEPALFQIAVDEAQAAVANKRIDAQLTLLADSSATAQKRELVANRSGLTVAQQQLARAKLDLGETKLVAPFSGEVAAVHAHVGERTQPNEPLVSLVALDVIRVPAEVLESDFGRLRGGAKARLTFAALPHETFEGRVQALSPKLDAERGTGIAWVQLENSAHHIRPGMYADVLIDADVYPDRLSVPRDAVLERDHRLLVFKTRGDRAKWQYVQTGLENDDRIEITSGLAAGDTVLVEGHLTLAHGARVDVSLRDD